LGQAKRRPNKLQNCVGSSASPRPNLRKALPAQPHEVLPGLRRIKGKAILDALVQGRKADRFTRAILPSLTEPNQETGFFFMTLALPKVQLKGGYEQYRAVRRNMLEAYALAFLEKNRGLTRMVGIATEPPSDGKGSSEDLLVIEGIEWTEKLLANLEQRKVALNIMKAGNFTEYPIESNEFPDPPRAPPRGYPPKMNRAERRRWAAEMRPR
jgi:hypothetical protein